MTMKKIALIHATPLSIDPIQSAFDDLWPETLRMNLLDDTLSKDRDNAGELTPDITKRILDLTEYAYSTGVDAVLFTCSAFAPAIESAARINSSPVLKPNEAMLTDALTYGNRIAVLASFDATIPTLSEEIHSLAIGAGRKIHLETRSIPTAMAALGAGNGEEHDRLLADAAEEFESPDVILLAQYSTARAKAEVEKRVSVPVLTSPASAVKQLQSLLLEQS